jgi:signal transduction histidine kinase
MDIQCKLAHELNNAFAVIAGHIDLLSDSSPQDPALAAHLAAMRDALQRAASLVHDCQCALAFDELMERKRNQWHKGNGRGLVTAAEPRR